MPQILGIPKVQITLILLLIDLSALLKFPNSVNFNLLIMGVGFTVGFDLLFTYIRKKVLFIPYAAVVSGLILTLIVDQSSSLVQIATISALAMGVKNFLRISGRHIFNPVASGLFIGGLVFNQYASWWGVSFQNITQSSIQNLPFFLILLSPALVSILRFKKHYAMLAFMITNVLLTQLFYPFSSLDSLTNKIFDPSTIFFILVMLPEPMTSPISLKNQLFYGVFVAATPFIFSHPSVINFFINNNLAFDSLLFALLLGNLIFFKNK